MKSRGWRIWRSCFFIACAACLGHGLGHAQERPGPGRSIGRVTTRGDLILMELDEGALGKANLFDLSGRTLRFTPEEAAYRVENLASQWDPQFGAELSGPQVKLTNFLFPFSGRSWDSLSVGLTGSISFGEGQMEGRRLGGVSIARFAQLQEAGPTLIDTVPAICVFFKPRMSGTRYLKELADRVVITWDLTEPAGGIQDFTWVKTVNRFQLVLHKDGTIEMSYEQVTARDAIVGIFPIVKDGVEKPLETVPGEPHPALPAHLDVRNIKVSVVDGLFLKIVIETRGPALAPGDPALAGIAYRIGFVARQPSAARPEYDHPDALWTIRGVGPGSFGGRGGGRTRYIEFGPGILRGATVEGNTVSVTGTLPPGFQTGRPVGIYAEAAGPGSAPPEVARVPLKEVTLTGIRSPEADLSRMTRADGPFRLVYEAFHYLALPNPRDLSCTVIKALGDRFDFLAYYSDFRIDNQEAGTPSNGPLGGGPSGGAVTGIGATQHGMEDYCTAGRFQWEFIQPVYAGSNQMQERPPEETTSSFPRDITFYSRQLGERTPDGKILPYNYAMSQLGHEMDHRWGAFISAKINGETIPLGPTHWNRGLQAPAAFPYQRPTEASAMGGGVWQDNFDGTYTQLDDDYYVPATGYSHLDLYLMGLISAAEVADFFLLRNLVPAGKDANGHPIFKADRLKVTIQDVIAAEGPRLPDVDHAQKRFNTGMVMIVEHGKTPSRELIERTEGIRERWIDYWATVTGHRASMIATPK